MEIKVLGMKCRVELLVLAMLVGAIAGCHLLCSCSSVKVKEGMEGMGASLDYKLGDGVHGSWDGKKMEKATHHLETTQGPSVPLSEGQLYFFGNNAFKPECCDPASSLAYSSGLGCACVTKEQVDYINKRGGNRSDCGGGF